MILSHSITLEWLNDSVSLRYPEEKSISRTRSWKDRDDGMSRQELENSYYEYPQGSKGKHEHCE